VMAISPRPLGIALLMCSAVLAGCAKQQQRIWDWGLYDRQFRGPDAAAWSEAAGGLRIGIEPVCFGAPPGAAGNDAAEVRPLGVQIYYRNVGSAPVRLVISNGWDELKRGPWWLPPATRRNAFHELTVSMSAKEVVYREGYERRVLVLRPGETRGVLCTLSRKEWPENRPYEAKVVLRYQNADAAAEVVDEESGQRETAGGLWVGEIRCETNVVIDRPAASEKRPATAAATIGVLEIGLSLAYQRE
jgi:hypothetical protein